jgi:secreted trypsin-like serine protease
MPKPIGDARRTTIVRDAVAHAQKTAGKDDRAFLEALRTHARAKLPAPGGGGRALTKGSAAPKGPRLSDDPRYLKSVRALARRHMQNARIIGGNAVSGHDFDDCVAVGDDTDFGCTGTLIVPNAVLTAGHCEVLHTRIFVGNNTRKRGRVYRVARHVRHPGWNENLHDDLMLLILEKPVTGVTPRGMATSKVIDGAADVRVVGFGTTDLPGTKGYGVKRQTDVPIVSPTCTGKVGGRNDETVYGCHRGKELVAGKPLLLHDTCRGDSGGPLYVADARGRWLLAGVTSRGTDLAKTMCGDGGLYTRVDKYRTWIASQLK